MNQDNSWMLNTNAEVTGSLSENKRTAAHYMVRGAPSLRVLLALLVSTVMLSACDGGSQKASFSPAIKDSAWDSELKNRRTQIEDVIRQNRVSFDAFDSGSLGDASLELLPYVVFRVLQELEPAILGVPALEETGFFARQDIPSGRNGISWTRPSTSADGTFKVRYMTRTCAACHTGRVRLDDGSTRVLHGGVNTEMNVHVFNARVMTLLTERLGASNDTPEYQAFRKRIVDALDSHPPEWFWGTVPGAIPAEVVAKELETVKANLDKVFASVRAMNTHRLGGVALLKKISYDPVPNSPSLTDGAPGLVETSGLGSSALIGLNIVPMDKLNTLLPPGPAKADIPAVWMIDAHGYANWDATLKGFARSMTSSLALVGDGTKIDLPQNALIQAFLPKLPPEPYPFDIDTAARARGKVTFEQNCASCHDATPGRSRDALIFSVDTDPLRADAITPLTAKLMSGVIQKVCPPTQPECIFEKDAIVVDPSSKRGYVGGSLYGVWAQAPYLHNGSIPTLRQLLVPELRTSEPFLRGSISYDQKNGGWEWDPAKEDELRKRGDTALALHDIRQAGFGNIGHGSVNKHLVMDGRGAEVRISWSNSEAEKGVVDDLIAYLLSL